MTNFRNVLKAYTLLRSLNDDETALLETLRGLSDTERELTVAALSPATSKKSTKKAATKTASKSRRAASLGAAIGSRSNHTPNVLCGFQYHDESFCDQPQSNLVHDKTAGYAGYHEFQPPKSVTAITAKDDNYQEQAGAVVGGN